VISEEHEFNLMPAQLTLAPVIDYKISRDHEQLVEVFYGDYNDENHVTTLIDDVIRNLVKEIGGMQKINSTVILHYEEKVVNSFLGSHGERLATKLRAIGFSVDFVSTVDLLKGAEHFAHSQFFNIAVSRRTSQQ
jgi:hypothetical protein